MGLAHPARMSKDLCGAGTKGRYKRRIGFPCVFRDSYLSLITVPLLVYANGANNLGRGP
jgi:hypothetical protein